MTMTFSNQTRHPDSAASGGDDAGDITPATLQIVWRRGIYRVTRDGVFHGDYTKARWANESAEDVARALRKEGRRAHIVMGDEQARQP